jgi:DNA polymerase
MTFQDSRRARFLQEMGIDPLWSRREQKSPVDNDAVGMNVVAKAQSDEGTAETFSRQAESMPQGSPTSSVVDRKDAVPGMARETPASAPPHPSSPAEWEEEVPAWVTETMSSESAIPFDVPEIHESESVPGKPSAAEIAGMDWEALESAVSICTKCRLCESRARTVLGTGDRQAQWLFVGEGPGYNEDLQGEPFVGPAGKLLDNMLAAMGLRRGENAYIANVVKCRPTGDNGRDRPPAPDEAAACMPYLERQIALIQPDVIVALGKSAALALLQASPDTPVSKLRGQVHRHGNVPLIVTYHPAYLLRSLEEKGKAWRDLCLAMATHADAATSR